MALHVVLVLQDPNLAVKKDVERFVWNFLASRTANRLEAGKDGEITHCPRSRSS
jgi:hypothetical protein